MEIEDSLFSMDFDDLDVFWMVSDRVMKSRWRTMKSPGWVMKSGVFRYVCIFCMSNCKNIVREKRAECRRRGVKVLMINILDSFTYNVVQYIAELGADD